MRHPAQKGNQPPPPALSPEMEGAAALLIANWNLQLTKKGTFKPIFPQRGRRETNKKPQHCGTAGKSCSTERKPHGQHGHGDGSSSGPAQAVQELCTRLCASLPIAWCLFSPRPASSLWISLHFTGEDEEQRPSSTQPAGVQEASGRHLP